jgi:hypothetical protein
MGLYSERETLTYSNGTVIISMDSAIALGDAYLITISISDFNDLIKVTNSLRTKF